MADDTDIIKRIDEGKCLLCNKELGKINPESLKELRKVKYYNKEALICRRHYCVTEVQL